jgi:hypothetical protein
METLPGLDNVLDLFPEIAKGLCACGHRRNWHAGGQGGCQHAKYLRHVTEGPFGLDWGTGRCPCATFDLVQR